jgi:hypothetical protein
VIHKVKAFKATLTRYVSGTEAGHVRSGRPRLLKDCILTACEALHVIQLVNRYYFSYSTCLRQRCLSSWQSFSAQYLLRHSNCAAHTHSYWSVQSENKPLKSVATLFFQVSTADTTSVRLVSEMFPAPMTGLLVSMLL